MPVRAGFGEVRIVYTKPFTLAAVKFALQTWSERSEHSLRGGECRCGNLGVYTFEIATSHHNDTSSDGLRRHLLLEEKAFLVGVMPKVLREIATSLSLLAMTNSIGLHKNFFHRKRSFQKNLLSFLQLCRKELGDGSIGCFALI